MLDYLVTALRHPRKSWRGLRGHVDGWLPESDRKRQMDAQAYWEKSLDRREIRDLSHWRGTGRWSEESWRKVGEKHLGLVRTLRQLTGASGPCRAMLEWGPGGGANAVSFAAECQTFYGVDVSGPNLEECGRQLLRIGFTGFRPCLIAAEEPESVANFVREPLDLFLSTAVYQHFPGKEYGRRVTRAASQLLAGNGLALIQTRYDDGRQRFRAKVRNYASHALTFTSYRVEEFWELLEDEGLQPLAVRLQPEPNYAFYLCKKPKSPTK